MQTGRTFHIEYDALLAPAERPLGGAYRTPLPGAALDLGCGTGERACELARRGWSVTGVDESQYAIARARSTAAQAGLDIRFLRDDVTHVSTRTLARTFDLVLDAGCFHGLDAQRRRDYVGHVTDVTEPGGTLLLFAFGPGYRGPLPSGASRMHVERLFHGWTLVADLDADSSTLIGPLKHSDPRWFRLVRD
ncbi:class I SAM-dependent methyltransferase [Rhodococcus sp. HNM0569]|nr:class I SAM-dependent methyltransferase [Rhodococcus sp. HNM0569]NLU82483.1 class I SAM-dependent methyltransferase [Rhodococcus sp. HNM0569]